MISIRDEQIKQALEAAGVEFQYFTHARTNAQMCTTEGSISFDLIANGVRALIALAQEVKPLDFKLLPNGCVHAETPFGDYDIDEDEDGFWFCMNGYYDDEDIHGSEEEAIEAANVDYRKRALSCLVNGGV